MADVTKAYSEPMSLSVNFLIVENECMGKELKATGKRKEKSIGSTIVEMKKVILSKVSTLETIMERLYDRFVTMHKAIFHLHGHQQCYINITCTLTNMYKHQQ